MMDEENARLLANTLILYFLFGVRAEDIERADEETKRKLCDLLESDLEDLKILGISVAQQKIVDMILEKNV